MGSGDILTVTLKGGTPWGFRLIGGEGFPIEIAKIRKKSKAHNGGLQEGDVLLKLNGTSVKGKSHEDVMYLVDNAGENLVIEIQRPHGKKIMKEQQTTEQSQSSDPNIVSSTSANYTITEGDTTRKVLTHQYQENVPGGLKSNTFVKQELVSSDSRSQPAPKQVYVDIRDQNKTMKENMSPEPNHFQPKMTSTPVPQFRVRNVRDMNCQPPTQRVIPLHVPEPTPAPEENVNIPMFRVTKFQPHVPQSDAVHEYEPEVICEPEEPDQQLEPYIPPAPPPPSALRNVENEPMLFPVPKPTFSDVRQMVYIPKPEGDDEVDEHEYYDEHGNRHLPIFAPPVEIALDDPYTMDSGYDESLMTPGSGARPQLLPMLGLVRTHSLESGGDVPSTPETGSTGVRKKKKHFADSAFYDDPNTNYPTIEEQVDLCKKIARSLTSAANRRARGAKMFLKRKRKSSKWIHEGEPYLGSSSAGDVADLRDLDSELSPTEGGTKPLFTFRIPNLANRINYTEDHKMSLSRDEFERLRLNPNRVEHTSVSPSTCHSLVADLQSPRNRGAKLFQKRAARSEKWVIDESNAAKPSAHTRLEDMVSTPPKPTLSPWEAACQNPLGSVDKAFDHLDNRQMVSQVNRTLNYNAQYQPPKPRPMSVPQYQPVVQPVTVPFQQTVTRQTNLRAEEQPNVVSGPNYNRMIKGWGADQRDGSTRHRQMQTQYHAPPPAPKPALRQEPPPPPPPPQKPLKQQENYNRKIQAWSSGPGSSTKTTKQMSSVTTPYYGDYGQPQGYTTTDSYNYQMTSVTDF